MVVALIFMYTVDGPPGKRIVLDPIWGFPDPALLTRIDNRFKYETTRRAGTWSYFPCPSHLAHSDSFAARHQP